MEAFNLFNDIQHKPLQAYNRSVMFYNIMEDHGRGVAEEYVSNFSPEERELMAVIILEVRKRGSKAVVAQITKGMVFTDE